MKKGRPSKYANVSDNVGRLYRSKKGLKNIDLNEFNEWYHNQGSCCAYCGIRDLDCAVLFEKYPEATRGGKRGKRLELDRIDPFIGDYGADINNLALACYWCNNAKTNYFTFKEFKIIGKAIGEIHKNRLQSL